MCHDEIRVSQDKSVPHAAAVAWSWVPPGFGGSQGGKSNLRNSPEVASSCFCVLRCSRRILFTDHQNLVTNGERTAWSSMSSLGAYFSFGTVSSSFGGVQHHQDPPDVLRGGHRPGSGEHLAPLWQGKGEEQTHLQNEKMQGQHFQAETLQLRLLHSCSADSRPFLPWVLSALTVQRTQLQVALLSTTEKG